MPEWSDLALDQVRRGPLLPTTARPIGPRTTAQRLGTVVRQGFRYAKPLFTKANVGAALAAQGYKAFSTRVPTLGAEDLRSTLARRKLERRMPARVTGKRRRVSATRSIKRRKRTQRGTRSLASNIRRKARRSIRRVRKTHNQSKLLRIIGVPKYKGQVVPNTFSGVPWQRYLNSTTNTPTNYDNLYGFALSTGNEPPGKNSFQPQVHGGTKQNASGFWLPSGSGVLKCLNMDNGRERYQCTGSYIYARKTRLQFDFSFNTQLNMGATGTHQPDVHFRLLVVKRKAYQTYPGREPTQAPTGMTGTQVDDWDETDFLQCGFLTPAGTTTGTIAAQMTAGPNPVALYNMDTDTAIGSTAFMRAPVNKARFHVLKDKHFVLQSPIQPTYHSSNSHPYNTKKTVVVNLPHNTKLKYDFSTHTTDREPTNYDDNFFVYCLASYNDPNLAASASHHPSHWKVQCKWHTLFTDAD